MKLLIASQTESRNSQEIPLRDAEWLSAFCCEKKQDAETLALSRELCALAAQRFCERRLRRIIYSPYDRRETSIPEKSLPLPLKALATSGSDEDLSRVLRFV